MTVMPFPALGERYELGEVIGRGGMADVYRARDRILGRQVAIKVLREASADAVTRERFSDEARTLASLDHPGLVTLLDAGITQEHPYLVMQLVHGSSLAATIQQADGAGLDPDRVAAMGCQLAEALAYAHQSGVVHRDVKPGNILICDDDGRVLLTDFGIARLLADAAHHTRTGDTIGSPAYLSPEQVDGSPLTAAVDIYSLGLVLLEALTGARAYAGSPVEAAMARLTTPPAIPESLDPGWRSLLRGMTERDPGARPSALEVAATLGAAVSASSAPQLVAPTDIDTSALDLTREVPLVVPHGGAGVGSPERRGGARRAVAVVLAVAVLVGAVLAGLSLFGEKNGNATSAYEAPAAVPARLRQPLEDLHQAVGDNRLLTPRLAPIDRSLSTRQFALARRELAALARATRAARTSGALDAADASRVLAAITRLSAALPAAGSTSGSPGTPGSPVPDSGVTASTSSTPSPTAGSTAAAKPAPAPSPATTPTPSPTPQPSETVTPDPSASPAAGLVGPSPSVQ